MAIPDRIKTHRRTEEQKGEILRALSEALRRHEEIVFATVHGSFLAEGPFRDLDIGLYLDRTPDCPVILYELRTEQELEAALQAGFPLDVRVCNKAPIAFQFHVLRGQLLLDRDPDFRAEITAYVLSRYFDIKPVLDHFAREAFGRESRT